MKILFVWSGVTSYMSDCWRTLAARADVELKIVIAERRGGYGTAFRNEEVMRGLDWQLQTDARETSLTYGWRPDLAFIVGWHEPVCRAYAQDARLCDVPKVCCFDMPWEWRLRKLAARFVLAPYLRKFSAAFVPGEVAARYAHWLGFPDNRVYRGLFGIDTDRFAARETASGNFLFVGRLSPEKRIDVLAAAYRAYRERTTDPCGLDVYGVGECEPLLRGLPGVTLRGFVQPTALPQAYARARALVLPSAWDPWPLVVAESCAAGLPIICTDHCWNVPELVKGNGRVVKAGDVQALSGAMQDVSSLDGSGGKALVAAYSCDKWVERILQMAKDVAI